MRRLSFKWALVAGGVVLSALDGLSNAISLSDMMVGAVSGGQWFESTSKDGGPVTLDVLTYNVFMGTLLSESRDDRALLIPDQVEGYDAVLLQGAVSGFHRKLLLDALEDEYPHQSRGLGRDRLLKRHGGVVILSRWPIELERQRLFGDACTGMDCLVDKGVLYARIDKQDQTFHLFASHLQSGVDDRQTRAAQLRTIKRMIDELEIPTDEPVLIGGTLNVDRFTDKRTNEFTRMLHVLDAAHPAPPEDHSHEPTFAPSENPLASGSTARYVDYLLYSNAHLRPREAFNAVRRIAADGAYLSDHFAVHGRFVLVPGSSPEPAPITGIAAVADTATLRIGGTLVRLFGVRGAAGAPAQQMAAYLGDREIHCQPANGNRYSCALEGRDLSEVVLFNGGGRADEDAPPELVEAERKARAQGRGIWADQQALPESG